MLVITGTGRSGTTMIAQWLEKCGKLPYKGHLVPQFNSGYEPADVSRLNSAIWLGNDPPMQSIPAQEVEIKRIDYSVIKDSKFFYGNVLNTWLSYRQDFKVLISLRKFGQVEKSRRDAMQLNMVRSPQELEQDLGRFISQLVFNDIPFEIIRYPEFLDSYDEVFDKIMKLEPSLEIKKEFHRKDWNECVNKGLISF